MIPLAQAREVTAFGLELVQAYRRASATRDDVLALQAARLRNVLTASRSVPLYAEHAARALDELPPLRKSTLLERIDETVADPSLTRARLIGFVTGEGAPGEPLFGKYLAATTSGTTGQVGVFVDSLEGWARQRAIVFARMFQGLLTPEGFGLLARRRYRLAFVVATGGHLLTSILGSRVPRAGQLVMQSRVLSIDSPLSRIVNELNAYRPMLLHTYPTFLEVLAAEKRRGALDFEPELLTVGSEPVSLACREAVAEAFPRARLVETYAATECLAMATACPVGNLHINEDACILEPVDDDLRPVPYGHVAPRVLVTNLLNTVQPLLRYELTDSLIVEDRPCPCGSPFLRLRVFGRTDDTFYFVDGSSRAQVHPPIPIECAFLGQPGLLQYQLVHERQNRLRLAFVVEPGASPAQVAEGLDQRLARYLDEHGLLDEMGWSVEQVDAIERHARSRKLRQITSRVGRPPGVAIPASQARKGSS